MHISTSIRSITASLLTIGLLIACGSTAGLGESCTNEGATDGCIDGAVCGKGNSDKLVCMKMCKSQSDCPANSNCNGIKGDTKACRSNL